MKIHPKVSILFSIFQIFLYIFVALIETLNTWNTMNRIRSKAARGMFAAFFYSQMMRGLLVEKFIQGKSVSMSM